MYFTANNNKDEVEIKQVHPQTSAPPPPPILDDTTSVNDEFSTWSLSGENTSVYDNTSIRQYVNTNLSLDDTSSVTSSLLAEQSQLLDERVAAEGGREGGVSAAVLQAIRQQMAVSLQRMRELEEQVRYSV